MDISHDPGHAARDQGEAGCSASDAAMGNPKNGTMLSTRRPFPDLRRANGMSPEAAMLFYAEEASFYVIPLEYEGKAPHPIIAVGWTHKASRDPKVIRGWIKILKEKYGGKFNVGIVFKREGEFCALDLDRKDGALDGVKAFAGQHEHALGPTARTPSTGVHRIFRKTDDDRLRNRSPRGAGHDIMVTARQIVGAPSEVPGPDGQLVRYRWEQGGEPAPLPSAVLDKSIEISNSKSHRENDLSDAPGTPGLGTPIKHNHPLDTVDNSHGMYDLGRHCYRFFGDRSDADILATVWAIDEYREAALSPKRANGDEDRALEWMWRYAVWPAEIYRVVFPEGDGYDPRPLRDRVSEEDLPPWENETVGEGKVHLRDIPSIWDLAVQYADPPQFIIPSWLPRKLLTTIYGTDGLGKTVLIQHICTRLAKGFSIMGRPAGDPQKCLLLLTEDTPEAIIDRQRAIFRDLGIPPGDPDIARNLVIPPDLYDIDARMMKFDREGEAQPTALMAAIEDYVERECPDVVVLDPISDVYNDDENRRDRVVAFMRALNRLAFRHDIAVILLGHPAKSAESEYSGSGAWSSKSRSRWLMQANDKGGVAHVLISNRKTSYGKKADDVLAVWKGKVLTPLSMDEKSETEVHRQISLENAIRDTVVEYMRAGKENCVSHSRHSHTNWLGKKMRALGYIEIPETDAARKKQDEELEAELDRLERAGVLSKEVLFDGGEDRPLVVRVSSGNKKSGIWFSEYPTKTSVEIERDRGENSEGGQNELPDW